MKTLITVALLAACGASSLAETPAKLDLTLDAGLYATHVGDYLSTEQCIHGNRCKEAVLPQALVHRNGLFAAYEFSTASLEVYGAYRLTKLGHPKLARVIQAVNISYTARVVANNYELTWRTPHMTGVK
jgi:hypothetical protein